MHILEHSPRLLRFKSTGWVFFIIAAVFLGFAALAAGLAAMGAFDMPHIEVKDGKPNLIPSTGSWDERKVPYLIGAGLGAVALLIIVLGAGSTTCTFDEAGGDLTIDRKRLVGGGTTAYRLKEIIGAEVESTTSTDSDGDRSTAYRTVLLFANGTRVPLTAVYTSARKEEEAKADLINQFLRGA